MLRNACTCMGAASSTESMRASASATTILLSLMYIMRVKVREITGVMMILEQQVQQEFRRDTVCREQLARPRYKKANTPLTAAV